METASFTHTEIAASVRRACHLQILKGTETHEKSNSGIPIPIQHDPVPGDKSPQLLELRSAPALRNSLSVKYVSHWFHVPTQALKEHLL